jgi:hypothetical protein
MAKATEKRKVMSRHMVRRMAGKKREGFERLQQRAITEGGSSWPPTDEGERLTLFEAGATVNSRIVVVPERHSRYKWAVVAIDPIPGPNGVGPAPERRL